MLDQLFWFRGLGADQKKWSQYTLFFLIEIYSNKTLQRLVCKGWRDIMNCFFLRALLTKKIQWQQKETSFRYFHKPNR